MKGGAAFPVRVRFTKEGRVRFIGHRDIARAFDRAFRIAELPLAYSEGFSPRPKVSFGLALSVGYESDAEYLDVELREPVDLDAMAAALSAALPEGIDVTGTRLLADRAPALQEAVTAVIWTATVPDGDLDAAVAHARTATGLPVARTRKGRTTTEDVAPAIRRIDVAGPGELEFELAQHPVSVRPDELLTAIGDLVATRVRRLSQVIERDGARYEPLDADGFHETPPPLEVMAS